MASNLERIQLMLSELPSDTPEITAITRHDDNAMWSVEFEDESMVTIEWADECDSMFLSTYIGVPKPEREIEVWRVLLSYNLLRNETGGVSAAVASDSGEASLLCDLHAADLQLASLQMVLRNFMGLARDWMNYVTGDDKAKVPEISAGLPGIFA